MDFYGTIECRASAAAAAVQKALKKDNDFRLSSEFGGSTSNSSRAAAHQISVTIKKLDWTAQQDALDKMFDQSLEQQLKNLPDIEMSPCLQNISLLEYQVLGIKWLVKREMNPLPAPFYKKVKENQSQMYLCEITHSSQVESPKPICGSVLCDEMGLGELKRNIVVFILMHRVNCFDFAQCYRQEHPNYWIDSIVSTKGCRIRDPFRSIRCGQAIICSNKTMHSDCMPRLSFEQLDRPNQSICSSWGTLS